MNSSSDLLPLPMEPADIPAKKILIVALGGCGAKTLNSFARLPGSGLFQTLLLETDKDSAEHCSASSVLRVEANWATNSGLGCGGDPKKSRTCLLTETQ